MKLPLALAAYRTLTGLAAPVVRALLEARQKAGKEEAGRLDERWGQPGQGPGRPDGPLVWIHGASVGESLLGHAIAGRLRAARPDLGFLFTSGTVTSARLIASRLTPRDRHRYIPADLPRNARTFIQYWRPQLGVFVEGELWPNLILEAEAAGVPLALANARMTARSLRGWGRVSKSARQLLDCFEAILPADAGTRAGIEALSGRALPAPGNLKLASPVSAPDAAEVTRLSAALAARPVWLAASTHAGEDEIVVRTHALIRAAAPEALLILAPRHPERTAEVEASCRMQGLVPVRRSTGAVPGPSDPVWLWDTMGELTLAQTLAPVTVLGGSLVDGIGGHNPVEPVAMGSAVVSGLKVFNFADLFVDLEAAGGARLVGDEHQLALAVAGLLADPEQRAAMTVAARAVVAEGAGAMDRAIEALLPLIPTGAP